MRRGHKEEAAQRGIQGASGKGVAVGEKTLAELSAEFGVHPTMISNRDHRSGKRVEPMFWLGISLILAGIIVTQYASRSG